MEALSIDRLNEIASARGIDYTIIEDPDPLVVRSKLSRAFPVAQEDMFDAFSDPVAHVGLFQIMVGSSKAIRQGLEEILPENQFYAFEHVQEANLPPRVMLVRYTLERPNRIIKEAATDPFSGDEVASDRKRGVVKMEFDKLSQNETRLTASSTFHAETGSVFARGFIDRVWLNFFERLMFANGQIEEKDYLT